MNFVKMKHKIVGLKAMNEKLMKLIEKSEIK
jgi:hypothetical protein